MSLFQGLVVDQNSTLNKTINDAIGNKGDYLGLPYVQGDNSIMAHLNTGYKHIHNSAFCYPERANPVTIAKAIGVWAAYPAPTEVIPANTISVPFDLHWILASDISATGYYTIKVYSGGAGAETQIAVIATVRTGNFVQEGNLPLQIPQQLANSRISVAISSSNNAADTISVKFYYHTYG